MTCSAPGWLLDPSKKFSKLLFFTDSLGSPISTPAGHRWREIHSLLTYFPGASSVPGTARGAAVTGTIWPAVMQAVVKERRQVGNLAYGCQRGAGWGGCCMGLSRYQWGSKQVGACVQDQQVRVHRESLCCVVAALARPCF